MSAKTPPPLGAGLYFIDVLACLLFCLVLALVGARFGHELTVDVDLPDLQEQAGTGAAVEGPEVAIREGAEGTELYLEGERVSLETLEAALRGAPPPSVVVRSEDSALARVIGIAHAAGVHDIQIAYEAASETEASR